MILENKCTLLFLYVALLSSISSKEQHLFSPEFLQGGQREAGTFCLQSWTCFLLRYAYHKSYAAPKLIYGDRIQHSSYLGGDATYWERAGRSLLGCWKCLYLIG